MLASVKAVSAATPARAIFVAVSVATGWIGATASSPHGSFGSEAPTGDVEGDEIGEPWDEGGVGPGPLGGPDDQTVTATRTAARPTPPRASRARRRRRSRALRDPAPDPFMAARSSLNSGVAGGTVIKVTPCRLDDTGRRMGLRVTGHVWRSVGRRHPPGCRDVGVRSSLTLAGRARDWCHGWPGTTRLRRSCP